MGMSIIDYQDREARAHERERRIEQDQRFAEFAPEPRFQGTLASPHDTAWVREWIKEAVADPSRRPRAEAIVCPCPEGWFQGDMDGCLWAMPRAAWTLNQWIKAERGE